MNVVHKCKGLLGGFVLMTGAPGETFYSLADILSEMKGI